MSGFTAFDRGDAETTERNHSAALKMKTTSEPCPSSRSSSTPPPNQSKRRKNQLLENVQGMLDGSAKPEMPAPVDAREDRSIAWLWMHRQGASTR